MSTTRTELAKGQIQPEEKVVTIDSFMLHADQFSIGKKIGDGAFANVYQGLFNKHPIAIKQYDFSKSIVKKGVDVKAIATIGKNLNACPYFVKFIGWTKNSIVNELMPRGSLYSALFKRKPGQKKLTSQQLLTIAIDIANAIEFLHSKELVHRDIKADNVLLDDNLRAKLADIDSVSIELPYKEILCGTPGSVAPEALTTKCVAKTSDIYSFGICLLEMFLDNEYLFDKTIMATDKDDDIVSLPFNIASKNIMKRLEEMKRRDIPLKVIKLIEDCVKLDPKKRPTAQEALERLNLPTEKETISTTRNSEPVSLADSGAPFSITITPPSPPANTSLCNWSFRLFSPKKSSTTLCTPTTAIQKGMGLQNS